jgi:hypothetical protein
MRISRGSQGSACLPHLCSVLGSPTHAHRRCFFLKPRFAFRSLSPLTFVRGMIGSYNFTFYWPPLRGLFCHGNLFLSSVKSKIMKQLAIETPFDHLYRATLRLCDVSLYKWSKGVFSALRFSLCVHIVFLVQEFHLWSVELTIFILQPFIMLVLFCVIIPLLLSVLSHLLLVMNLLPIRSILHLDRMTWHLAFTSLYHWCLHRFIAFLDLLYPIMILIGFHERALKRR